MEENYSREDQSKKSLLASNVDFFKLVGEEIGRPKEFKEYREIFDKSTRDCKSYQDFPIHIDFELNFICNIKCTFCTHSLDDEKIKEWGDKKQKVTFETFKKIIDEGMPKGLRSIAFNGTNEPLTVKDLDKYIKYAKDSGVLDIMFNTNGLLLTKEISKKLIESGLTRLMISIDAFKKETYEEQRIGANYEKLVENILNFLEVRKEMGAKLPLVRLSFLAHANNIDEIEPFIEFWKDKIDFFAFQRLSDAFMYDEEKSESFREEFKMGEVEKDEFFDCSQPFVRVMIRNNGDVLPCCVFYGMKLPIGNIYENSLYDIYNGDAMKKIKQTVNDPDKQSEACRVCRSCTPIDFDLDQYTAKL